MLLEFSVGNYKSFKDVVTFSMIAAKISAKDKTIDYDNTFKVNDDLKVLKSAAIYGANASGKSNMSAATGFMRWLVLNSSKETQAKEEINVEAFRLSTDTEKKPSYFEIIFILDNERFRYGFEVDRQQVVSEWLFRAKKTREYNLFKRDFNQFKIAEKFAEGKEITEKTRNNALFISVVAQFNGKISQKILQWFQDLHIISGLNKANRDYTINSLQKKDYKHEIIQLIKKLDLGIDDIQVEQPLTSDLENIFSRSEFSDNVRKHLISQLLSNRRKTIATIHWKYNSNGEKYRTESFDIDSHESEGTKKLFALAGFLVDTLKKGKILLIDELDSSLHPLITCAIIDLFNSSDTNSRNAQFVFTTHDTNLLSNKIFRRDQIWFVEKDVQGATHLYSLVEFKVRNDASFESDYIHGKYGAIPFIGDLHRLTGGPSAEERLEPDQE
ncbi:abortive infection protein [Nostocales cyanobacterium HT-58-2]|nr:abortive infection protein [Nostocales cyanobacterium HT-58-2]